MLITFRVSIGHSLPSTNWYVPDVDQVPDRADQARSSLSR